MAPTDKIVERRANARTGQAVTSARERVPARRGGKGTDASTHVLKALTAMVAGRGASVKTGQLATPPRVTATVQQAGEEITATWNALMVGCMLRLSQTTLNKNAITL